MDGVEVEEGLVWVLVCVVVCVDEWYVDEFGGYCGCVFVWVVEYECVGVVFDYVDGVGECFVFFD